MIICRWFKGNKNNNKIDIFRAEQFWKDMQSRRWCLMFKGSINVFRYCEGGRGARQYVYFLSSQIFNRAQVQAGWDRVQSLAHLLGKILWGKSLQFNYSYIIEITMNSASMIIINWDHQCEALPELTEPPSQRRAPSPKQSPQNKDIARISKRFFQFTFTPRSFLHNFLHFL